MGSCKPGLQITADAQLGTRWRQIASDVFGEWNTYLLLAYGADIDAQLVPDVAQKAAEGWGGDRYQLYQNSESFYFLRTGKFNCYKVVTTCNSHVTIVQHGRIKI